VTGAVQPDERARFEADGFFVRPGFASEVVVRAMLAEAVALARRAGKPSLHDGALVMGESNLKNRAPSRPEAVEESVSKIFRLHRRAVFRDFIVSEPVRALVRSLLGPRVDCFLSQFIFKNPGAWGQPWHQDALYFPFDRSPQIGLWLAITRTTPENGPLHVLPGSQREPVHAHVPDRRPGANYGYLEIVDHDMQGSRPVLLEAGDLLVFHSHLMHASTDNVSNGMRAAMVYHCAESGTRDLSTRPSAVTDWMPLPAGDGSDA
jgi:phytanoyl-CoA hydroxylase